MKSWSSNAARVKKSLTGKTKKRSQGGVTQHKSYRAQVRRRWSAKAAAPANRGFGGPLRVWYVAWGAVAKHLHYNIYIYVVCIIIYIYIIDR